MKPVFTLFILTACSFLPKLLWAEVDINYINSLKIDGLIRSDLEDNQYGYSREEIIEELKRLEEDQNNYKHVRLLIRLKEKDIIKKYVDLFANSKGTSSKATSILVWSKSPWIIPPLISHLTGEEIKVRDHPNPERVGYHGLDASIVQVIHFTIIRSQEFPEEVRAWASEMNIRRTEDLIKAREVYLEWWELNEAAFLEERYDEIVPLKKDQRPDESQSYIEDAPNNEPAVHETFLPPEAEKPNDTTSVNKTQQVKSFTEENRWLLLSIGAFVLIGVCVVVFRRKGMK